MSELGIVPHGDVRLVDVVDYQVDHFVLTGMKKTVQGDEGTLQREENFILDYCDYQSESH